MLRERHAYDPSFVIKDCVTKLKKFTDFRTRTGGENSIVHDMYQKSGHAFALFGVKYHADLASIERKWMYLEQENPKAVGRFDPDFEKFVT